MVLKQFLLQLYLRKVALTSKTGEYFRCHYLCVIMILFFYIDKSENANFAMKVESNVELFLSNNFNLSITKQVSLTRDISTSLPM